MRRMGYVGLAVAFLLAPASARSADLQDAFEATFGHAPPITRHVNLEMPHQQWGETDLSLNPVLLVRVVGTRVALIISETFDGCHEAEGDVAVAYLDHNTAGWRLVRVWYEFAQTGSFGVPFPRHKVFSFNFGELPFFAGESEWCGFDSCNRFFHLIGLSPEGPLDWGDVYASGSLAPGVFTVPDSNGINGCGGYEYSSTISAPINRGDLMRVTYSGWMIPGGNGQKRRSFEDSAEVYLTNGKARLRPEIQIPNCGV